MSSTLLSPASSASFSSSASPMPHPFPPAALSSQTVYSPWTSPYSLLPLLLSSATAPYTLHSQQTQHTPAASSPAGTEQVKVSLILERQLPGPTPNTWASSSSSSSSSTSSTSAASNEWAEEEAALETAKRELAHSIQLILSAHRQRVLEGRLQQYQAAARAAADTAAPRGPRVDDATQTTPAPSAPPSPKRHAQRSIASSSSVAASTPPRSSASSPRTASSPRVAQSSVSPSSSPFSRVPLSEQAYFQQFAEDERTIRQNQQLPSSSRTPPTQPATFQPVTYTPSPSRARGAAPPAPVTRLDDDDDDDDEEDEAAARLEVLREKREKRRQEDAQKRQKDEQQQQQQQQDRPRDLEEHREREQQRAVAVRVEQQKAEVQAAAARPRQPSDDGKSVRDEKAKERQRPQAVEDAERETAIREAHELARQQEEMERLLRQEEENRQREIHRQAQAEADARLAAEAEERERQRLHDKDEAEKRELLVEMKQRLSYRQHSRQEEAEPRSVSVSTAAVEPLPVKAVVERVEDDDDDDACETAQHAHDERAGGDQPTPTIEDDAADEEHSGPSEEFTPDVAEQRTLKKDPPTLPVDEDVEIEEEEEEDEEKEEKEEEEEMEDEDEEEEHEVHEESEEVKHDPTSPPTPTPSSPDLSADIEAVTDGLLHDLTEDAINAVHDTRQRRRTRPQRTTQPAPSALEEKEVQSVRSATTTPPRRPIVPRLPIATPPAHEGDEKEAEKQVSDRTGTPKKSSSGRLTPTEEETAAMLSSLVSSWLTDSVSEWMTIQRASQQRLLAPPPPSEARLSPPSPSTPPQSSLVGQRGSPSSPQSADEYVREFGVVEDRGILDVSVSSDGSESLSEDSWTNTSWRADDPVKKSRGLQSAEYVDGLLKEADDAIEADSSRDWRSDDLLTAIQRRRRLHPTTPPLPSLLLHDADHLAFHHFVLDLLIQHRAAQAQLRKAAQPWQKRKAAPPSLPSSMHPLVAQIVGGATNVAGWAGLAGLLPGGNGGAGGLQPVVQAVAEHARWVSRGDDDWKAGHERAQAELIGSVADGLAQQLLDELTEQLRVMELHSRT